jgi:hypothetical protein
MWATMLVLLPQIRNTWIVDFANSSDPLEKCGQVAGAFREHRNKDVVFAVVSRRVGKNEGVV